MAEVLCNNDDAVVTPRGLTETRPCGWAESYGWGWCNSKDFNDWVAQFQITLNAAISQFDDLVKILNVKGKELTEEQKALKGELEGYVLWIKTLKQWSAKDYTSQEYAQKISEIIVQIKYILCLIENKIQLWIEENNGVLRPTGLIKGSRKQSSFSAGTLLGVAGAVIVAAWVYNKFWK